MTPGELRKQVYLYIHNQIRTDKTNSKEWSDQQKDLSKLLKQFKGCYENVEPRIVYKTVEKIVYKKAKEDNYWGL